MGRFNTGGFATVAIWFGPFRCAKNLELRVAGYPVASLANYWYYAFAANFWVPFTYLSRHSGEQKCSNSLPFRIGIAIVSARCIPQTGSRTNFLAIESFGTNTSRSAFVPAAPILPTSRRSSDTLQETITIQNRNLRIRAINVIDFGPKHRRSELLTCHAVLRGVYAGNQGASNENV